jgi:uncharacterized protein YutE (UPF0331/DUF86 family)
MSNTEKSYEAYAYAVKEQLEQQLAGLDELSDISRSRPLSFNERNAAERGLQVIVEAAIGCSKHYLKSIDKPVPSEARAAIERVYELQALGEPDIVDMRGAVGMRNAIIHDYLNLDWSRISPVLLEKKYHLVNDYIQRLLHVLLSV